MTASRALPISSEQLDAELDVMAVQPSGRYVTSKARAFIDALAEEPVAQTLWSS